MEDMKMRKRLVVTISDESRYEIPYKVPEDMSEEEAIALALEW